MLTSRNQSIANFKNRRDGYCFMTCYTLCVSSDQVLQQNGELGPVMLSCTKTTCCEGCILVVAIFSFIWESFYDKTTTSPQHCCYNDGLVALVVEIVKGPVKLIKWVKKAPLFLHVTSKLFQFTVFNLSW